MIPSRLFAVLALGSLTITPPVAQEPGGVYDGGYLLSWDGRGRIATSLLGATLAVTPESEFVVHRAWQEILYRTSETQAAGGDDIARHASPAFRWERRARMEDDGVSIAYEYALGDARSAEVQVLLGVGTEWLDGCRFAAEGLRGRQTGEFDLPREGRVDPWSDVERLELESTLGTLVIDADRPFSVLVRPGEATLWWAEPLEPGAPVSHQVNLRVTPSEALRARDVLESLQWEPASVRGRVVATVEPRAGVTGLSASLAPAIAPVAWDGEGPLEVSAEPSRDGLAAYALTLGFDDGRSWEVGPLFVDGSPALAVLPRYSYEMGSEAQLIVTLGRDISPDTATIVATSPSGAETTYRPQARRSVVSVALPELSPGRHPLEVALQVEGERVAAVGTEVRLLEPRPNAVRIDRLTGGMEVSGLPSIPFGFYCYWPLRDDIIEDEVTRGFNLLSPYQGGPHDEDQLAAIAAYLDRCAAVGMRVNVHCMWAAYGEITPEIEERVRDEVRRFRDHPALLSWYIVDEPDGQGLPPERIERLYGIVSEEDPYHPVTVVFCTDAASAHRFEGGLDIVMVDPYPIPNSPVTSVANTVASYRQTFGEGRALWLVPQAFGGHEGWKREPTAAELRVMTYLGVIEGARGIQYFIRDPRSNFPKSPVAWSECAELGLEIAELTPALLSPEPSPEVTCQDAAIRLAAYRDRGEVTIIAVNTDNQPRSLALELAGSGYDGPAEVTFENRAIEVREGAIADLIDGFGTRVYRFMERPGPEDDLAEAGGNLTTNASWEAMPSVGVPMGCYGGSSGAATVFVDARLARHGRHSLRMTCPSPEERPGIMPFWCSLQAGADYRVSVWAKADRAGVPFAVRVHDRTETFELTTEWVEYSFTVSPTEDVGRATLHLSVQDQGTAWLDLFQVVPMAEP